jgi:periplasmic copper chaperone A
MARSFIPALGFRAIRRARAVASGDGVTDQEPCTGYSALRRVRRAPADDRPADQAPCVDSRAIRRVLHAAALALIPAALALSLALGLATPLWAGDTAGQTPDTCVCPEHVTLAQPAWIRLPPPNAPVTAAYMTLANDGDHDLTVVAAASPVAGTVELHEHLQDADGVMRMRQVASMPLPAGGTLTMEPGGLHVMLIDLLRPLAEGDAVPVTLRFADGQSLEVAAEVRRMAPAHAHGHQHH